VAPVAVGAEGPQPAASGSAPLVLLGAGASVEAGVPATFQMTQKLVEAIAQQPWSQAAQALNFVCGALVAYDAAGGSDPYAGLDVERVFAAVELLGERRSLEVTPFVGTWHPAVDVWDRPPKPSFFDRKLRDALLKDPPFDRARDELMKLIQSVTGVGTGATYQRLAEQMVQQLRSLVEADASSLDYLTPLVTAAKQPRGITVATLNYDLAIEQSAEAGGVPVDTGIDRWALDRQWTWADDGLRLLKLHGSIDWCWEAVEPAPGQLPHRTVARTDSPRTDTRPPVVVFGQRAKLRAEGPFLSLLNEFEAALSQADRLIVIGYSFRDDHVNEVIRQWTTEDLDRTLVLVDPSDPRNWKRGEFRTDLLNHLNRKPWEPEGDDRVEVLTATASEALNDLFP